MPDLYFPDPFSALPTPRVDTPPGGALPAIGAAITGMSSATRKAADAHQTKRATINALNSFADAIEDDDPSKAEALRGMAEKTELVIPFGVGGSGTAQSLKSAAGGITNEMLATIGNLVSDKKKSQQQLAEIAARGQSYTDLENLRTRNDSSLAVQKFGLDLAKGNIENNRKDAIETENTILAKVDDGSLSQSNASDLINFLRLGMDPSEIKSVIAGQSTPQTIALKIQQISKALEEAGASGGAVGGTSVRFSYDQPVSPGTITTQDTIDDFGDTTRTITIRRPINSSLDAAGQNLEKATEEGTLNPFEETLRQARGL